MNSDPSQERHEDRFSLSPRAFITPTLIGLNFAIFIGLWADGIAGVASIDQLIRWGGSFGPLTLSGEWWRLLSCSFVHSSLAHFSSNMVGLWFGGNILERRIGNLSFLTIYLASAALGSLASLSARPEIVAHGASAAVLGVYGTLFCLSFGQNRSTEKTFWLSDTVLSSFLISLSLAQGYLDDAVDNAGHWGGLLTGVAYGVALRVSSTRISLDSRTTVISLVIVSIFVAIATSLPRQIVIVDSEIRRYIATAKLVVDRFDTVRSSGDGDGVPVGEFREFLELEILPLARKSRARLEYLSGISEPYQSHIDSLIDSGRRREREWEVLAAEFALLEDTLNKLQLLEEEISRFYLEIQRQLKMSSLPRDRAAVQLFDHTVDPWDILISDLSEKTGLRAAVQDRINALQTYATLRQRAWALYAESVREQDPERAALANLDHQRASEMIRTWTD